MSYLMKGDIIKLEGKWLIFECAEELCLMILLETTKTRIIARSLPELEYLVDTDEAELLAWNDSENKIIPFPNTDAAVKIDKRIRSLAEEVQQWQGNLEWLINSHERAKFFAETSKKYEMSIPTIRRFLRDFLQNNMMLRSLGSKYYKCGGKGKTKEFSSGKRAGRKGISETVRTSEVIVQFDTMLQRYLKTKARMSMSMLYEDFCQKYYSIPKVVNGEAYFELYPAVCRPTQRQLSYYIKTHSTDAERYIAKRGPVEARNNIRPLHSDTIADLKGGSIGGRYEMDEMETDFYLVSRYDRNRPIGRAIFYAIIDVCSKMITGFSVGLDNNSWNGAKIALLNMAEDKVEICRKAGISITEEQWPVSGLLPREIEVDNGSEYLSENFIKYSQENGVHLEFVPARMGSYKPNVEQLFHQLNTYIKERLPGQIVKEEYGSGHIKKAKLTIEDFYKIVLEFIISYNNNVKTTYVADREVFVANIQPTPVNIWNLKVKKQNSLKKITDMNQYKYSLLDTGKAVITREGIVFSQVIYTCENIKWLESQMMDVPFNGRKSLDIRYDSRNMDVIYFELNGQIIKGWINPRKTSNEKYLDCSYMDVKEINRKIKILKSEGKELRLQEKIRFNSRIDTIVKEAKKNHSGKNSIKNIRESRYEEKERLHDETQIVIGTEMTERLLENDGQSLEKKSKGKAPSLIKMEEEMKTTKLTTLQINRYRKAIKYEVEVEGYDRE